VSSENAKTQEHDQHEDHGIGRYVVIFVTLLALTALTVITGKWVDLGSFNIILALIIASVKATLVVLFFMHLWDESAMNRLIFGLSVFFVGLLMLGTFGDIWFRLDELLPSSVPNPAWDGLAQGLESATHGASEAH